MESKAPSPRRRRKPEPFELSPGTAARMEEIMASAISAWLEQFTSQVFPDVRTTAAQDCILRGISAGIHRYEIVVGMPITQTLALNLFDIQDPE